MVLATPAATLDTPAPDAPRWTVQVEAGAALFTNSKSRTFQHLVRTTVRLEATVRVAPRLDLGVELAGVPSGDTNYRMVAGYLLAKVPVVEAGIFRLDLGWGFGIGTGPAILSNDLRVTRDVVPYVQLSVAARIAPTPWWLVGAEVIYEQLTVVGVVATLGGRF